ncbi:MULTISPECIES: hypothetical protein [unclassified Devosia]|uniref:hypothetical protein n=1 Tax=unclassified Devosia TaxID=196773 RepID=UPI00145CB4E9|nr:MULTISPECIES: hypothetical protein [unclassified Devosia]MBJ6988155.1 hypothetical protein [Devosia sp. MC521]QMW63438.1 hypothetical protein H4N61_03620 [Devosia sp. MC521]
MLPFALLELPALLFINTWGKRGTGPLYMSSEPLSPHLRRDIGLDAIRDERAENPSPIPPDRIK